VSVDQAIATPKRFGSFRVISLVASGPLTEVYRAVVPFLILGAIIVALVTYIPWLSLCLIGK